MKISNIIRPKINLYSRQTKKLKKQNLKQSNEINVNYKAKLRIKMHLENKNLSLKVI